MNWRKPVITGLLKLSGSNIINNLNYAKSIQGLNSEQIKQVQSERLSGLLEYAAHHVPYYRDVCQKSEVIKDGKILLENFAKLPTLTKEIIRNNINSLQSDEKAKFKCYKNASGGSTGMPVELIQDKSYSDWNISNKLYYSYAVGKDIGEKELKLWGSEKDIFEGTIGLKSRLQNFVYNRHFLNSFRTSEKDLEDFVNEINLFRPKHIWAYVDSMYELAKYIEKKKLTVHSPNSIVLTAGTMYEAVREKIEKVMQPAVVYNQYGSREVGDIACECKARQGLHIFPHTHYLEVLNEKQEAVPPGEMGELVITLLTNFSMPLIRFRIGDTGILAERECSCGCKFPLLKKVSGRVTDHFTTGDGTLVHGEYFTHLFYHKNWIRKFQVVQKKKDLIDISIVLEKEKSERDLKDIEEKIKIVMGKTCKVGFNFVEEILPSKSGKYLYTISLYTPQGSDRHE